MQPVDVDNPKTWPNQVFACVSEWAARYAGTTSYTNDLQLNLDGVQPFREFFVGYRLRAYHYTRLLPHEQGLVLNLGLRPLSAELLHDRIESAHTAGAISAIEASQLHQAHVFASNEHHNRVGQVCLVLSSKIFKRDPEACLPLLMSWGGEGIYKSSGTRSFRERLTKIGIPTVVTALLDLSPISGNHLIFPALDKVFLGSLLGLQDVGANVHYRAHVPPECIEKVETIHL